MHACSKRTQNQARNGDSSFAMPADFSAVAFADFLSGMWWFQGGFCAAASGFQADCGTAGHCSSQEIQIPNSLLDLACVSKMIGWNNKPAGTI